MSLLHSMPSSARASPLLVAREAIARRPSTARPQAGERSSAAAHGRARRVSAESHGTRERRGLPAMPRRGSWSVGPRRGRAGRPTDADDGGPAAWGSEHRRPAGVRVSCRSRRDARGPRTRQLSTGDRGGAEVRGELPPERRRVLLLRWKHGLSYAEIADATGISEETARAHVSRARKSLQGILRRFLED